LNNIASLKSKNDIAPWNTNRILPKQAFK